MFRDEPQTASTQTTTAQSTSAHGAGTPTASSGPARLASSRRTPSRERQLHSRAAVHTPDAALFVDDHEMAWLMAEHDLHAEEVRHLRAHGWL